MKFYIKRKLKVKKQAYKCYYREIERYKHLYNTSLSQKEALVVINTLKKVFNIPVKKVTFDFKSKKFGANADRWGNIRFKDNNIHLLIVCHELNHVRCFNKYPKEFPHSNIFYRELDKMIRWIENNITFKIKTPILIFCKNDKK